MRAEPALTERVSSGPRRGPKLGASQSWRARLEQSAALLAPVALIVGLALAGGGRNGRDRPVARPPGLLVGVALLVLAAAPRSRPWPPLPSGPGAIRGGSPPSPIAS